MRRAKRITQYAAHALGVLVTSLLPALPCQAAPPAIQPATAPAGQVATEVTPNPKARAHTAAVKCLAIDPTGKLLASCGDGDVKLWSLPDGKLIKSIQAHEGATVAVALVPAKKQLISIGQLDKSIKIWSYPDGKLVKTLTHPDWQFRRAVISPGAQFVACGGQGSETHLLSLSTAQIVATRREGCVHIYSMTWMDSDTMLAIGRDWDVVLWSPATRTEKTPFKECTGAMKAAISPDKRLFASVNPYVEGGSGLRLWSTATGALLKHIPIDQKDARHPLRGALLFTRNGKMLLHAGLAIRLYSVPGGEALKAVEKVHGGKGVGALILSQDQRTMISGGADGTLLLWSFPDCEVQAVLSDPDVTPAK